MYKKFLKTTGIILSAAVVIATLPVNAFASTRAEIPSNAVWGKTISSGESLAQTLEEITAKSKIQRTCKPDQTVDIIVELSGNPLSVKGKQTQRLRKSSALIAAHKEVKQEIAALTGGVHENGTNQVTGDGSGEFKFMHDFYTVLNGFSVKTKYRYLSRISTLRGVKRAFVAPVYQLEPRVEDTSSDTNYLSDSAAILKLSGAYQKGYKGQGMTIAVLDTGLDVSHEVFQKFEDTGVTGKLTEAAVKDKISDLKAYQDSSKSLTAKDVYHSEKVPFAYDYADKDTNPVPPATPEDNSHGTHVSGIAAGSGDKLQGVAPDAQICMMKVFSDDPDSPGASDDNIFAGLEDAVTLHVDAINMSLGSGAGFSNASTDAEKEVYENVKKAGINLVISAGNDYSSAYHNQSGCDLPYATSPDSGIVGSPSTYDAGISVASSIGAKMHSFYFKLSDGTKVDFSDSSSPSDAKLYDLSGDSLSYVVCGVGKPEDFTKAGNINGKIALVERGGISFMDKAKNAHAAGAAAIIIYDNIPKEGLLSIQTDPDLPDVFISNKDGIRMVQEAKKVILVSKDYEEFSDQPDANEMSDFSSWGVTPDLKLKPEITAPGQTIYSSFIGGYGNMQGTSMAAPQITGSETLIRQYVTNQLKETGEEAEKLTHTLLMSTAHPISDPSIAGSYYSPRKEGAGLADVGAAVNTPAYLSVDGETRPKAELGYNSDGEYHFSVTVNRTVNSTVNSTTDSPLTYDLSATALSEAVESDGTANYLSQHSSNYAGNGIDVSYSVNKVTVPSNKGTATVNVSLKLSDALKRQFDKDTPNGTFIDGFVMFQSENGAPTLSLPYVGFYGDWAKAPVFDSVAAGFDEAAAGGPVYLSQSGLTATTGKYQMSASLAYDSRTGLPYGTNPLELLIGSSNPLRIDNSRIAISPNGLKTKNGMPIFSALTTSTGLLRGAKSLTYNVTGSSGKTVSRTVEQDARKTYYSNNYGYCLFAELSFNDIPVFDGKDENGAELPEGVYTLSETAELAGTRGNKTAAGPAYTIAYDKTAPKILDAKIITDNGKRCLAVKATDNFYLSGMILGNMCALFNKASESTEPNGSRSCTAVFDLTGISGSDVLTVYDNATNSYSASVDKLSSFTPTPVNPGSGGSTGGGNSTGGTPNPVINPEPQPVPTFISDTNADLGVNGAYTFKITSKNGKAPSFTVSPSGVFDVKLVKSAGDDYFFKITAIGAPGTRASVYVNGIRLLTATIKSNPSYVKSDTTHPFRVKAGKSYVFKLTANAKPYFVAGTGTAFRVSFVRQSGKDYFFRVTAIGKVGTASGFYINHQKAPVAVATIGS